MAGMRERQAMSETLNTMHGTVPKLLLTMDEAAAALGVGKTLLTELLMRQDISSFKLGRRRLIPLAALEDFVTRQLAAA